jgi:hypothetical protein
MRIAEIIFSVVALWLFLAACLGVYWDHKDKR